MSTVGVLPFDSYAQDQPPAQTCWEKWSHCLIHVQSGAVAEGSAPYESYALTGWMTMEMWSEVSLGFLSSLAFRFALYSQIRWGFTRRYNSFNATRFRGLSGLFSGFSLGGESFEIGIISKLRRPSGHFSSNGLPCLVTFSVFRFLYGLSSVLLTLSWFCASARSLLIFASRLSYSESFLRVCSFFGNSRFS